VDGDIARTSEKCASLICVRFIGFSLHGHPELRPANNYAYYIYGVGHYTEVDCRPEDAFMQVYRPVAGRRSRASPSSITRRLLERRRRARLSFTAFRYGLLKGGGYGVRRLA